MKVIDLLNKIANKEEIPNKIKYDGEPYKFENVSYYNIYSGASILRKILLDPFYLLKEIEVIEEDKKTEKLDQTLNRLDIGDDYYRYIMENRFKINEIIDKVNSMEDK